MKINDKLLTNEDGLCVYKYEPDLLLHPQGHSPKYFINTEKLFEYLDDYSDGKFFTSEISLVDGELELIDMKGDGETEIWFEKLTETRLFVPVETIRHFPETTLNY
tara:strand:+ start:319 stop:636 length:318 start_codon:yes stop_codon:yes gene_type:complete